MRIVYTVATLVVVACAWQLASGTLPAPADVVSALGTLWNERGLFDQLSSSLALNLEAIAWSTAITLALAYATVVPAVRPLVTGLTKLRFTGMVGWGFVLTLATTSGHQLKLWMLVFGMTPFFLTAMAEVVAEIPKERFDHARTLGMSETRVVWEVVIRGTLDKAFETLRQNAAMGWMMLTTVEGVVRSEGGIGTMLLDENKHLALDAVFALILVVLVVGVAQDYALSYLRRLACPYADLAKDRR
jgi:NitT/TauT family transport system permease protein